MAEKVTADIGFEKQIWNAACVLRGNMDASEYKSVVLGLIFLKYISDRFEAKYQELVDEGDGFEEDIDEYTSEGIFFVPAGARWNEIARKLGTMVSRKLRELTEEDIQKIAGTHKAFVNGTLEEQKGYCAVVTTEDIAKQDYILTPGRYVGIEEQEDDDEPFEEKMARLTTELSEMFERSLELQEEIKHKLHAIGFEM